MPHFDISPIAVIVNLHARGNWVKHHWLQLEPILRRELDPSWILFTRGVGDGRLRGLEALKQGARLLISLGGDGTASEVASSLLIWNQTLSDQERLDPPRFSFLACGTGGDLRRTFGTPDSLLDAILALKKNAAQFIDAARIDYIDLKGQHAQSYFLNVASFGIGGLVDQLINRSSKRLGGKITYFLETLRATLRYRNKKIRLQWDDSPAKEVRIYDVAVCNGRYFGGGMKIAPQALMNDGFFDVVIHGDLTLWEILTMARPLYQGTHLLRPKVSLHRVQKIHAQPVQANEKVWLDVDGESVGCLPATFTVLPKALLLQI